MTPKPILLVEDTPEDAELTVMALKQSGLLNEVLIESELHAGTRVTVMIPSECTL